MKKLNLLFTFCLAVLTFAQAQIPPQAFNYSAVARNAAGVPIASSTVGIQVSILKTSTSGPVQYSENHFVNTDSYGLFNLIIGAGTVQSGSMANINWNEDNYYLKMGMDVNGGTNFLTMGTTQLLSVPYALHAATADSVIGGTAGFSGDYNDLTNQPVTISSISSAGDTLYLSNGQLFSAVAATTPNNSHYIGEEFGGGVIFHLWKDNNGIEHGLIVDLVNLSESEYWSNVTDQWGEYSNWDGLNNSLAIVSQIGHTNSAAALCLNSTNGGQNDWYLPSILELKLLWNNYFQVAKTFSQIPAATSLEGLILWSSSGYEPLIQTLEFYQGVISDLDISINSGWVRAIRAF